MVDPVDSEVTDDFILGKRVRLRQPKHGYRAAIDPVFLAATTPAKAGDRVLDVGLGVGAAALCLLARVADCRVTGLEIQPQLIALARQNAERNGFAGRLDVVAGNLALDPAVGPAFDLVMTNPPYLDPLKATRSHTPGKAAADMEGDAGLDAWIAFCVGQLRPGGRLVCIHRADRLDSLLGALRKRACGGIIVIPLWPSVAKPAARAIVLAQRGSGGAMILSPGLVLHRADGTYTDAAERILRHAEPLPF